jgi:hypothetical protein
MVPDDTKRQIRTTVERADEPALSAKQIAERTGLAVKTVNTHITALTESGELATTQIGNATAYYPNRVRGGSRGSHQHQCRRCGRAVIKQKDMARVDVRHFYGESPGVSEHEFYLLCRFCESHLSAWLFGDTNRGYPYVHKWDIPTDQLRDIQEDETVRTTPPQARSLPAEEKQIYDLIRRIEQDHDEDAAPAAEVRAEYAEMNGVDWDPSEISRRGVGVGMAEMAVMDRLVNSLVQKGWVEKGLTTYRTARDAAIEGHPEPGGG